MRLLQISENKYINYDKITSIFQDIGNKIFFTLEYSDIPCALGFIPNSFEEFIRDLNTNMSFKDNVTYNYTNLKSKYSAKEV